MQGFKKGRLSGCKVMRHKWFFRAGVETSFESSLFIKIMSVVNFLDSLSHPNIVRLMGYCLEDKELLVREFIPEEGAAKGLLFLHRLDKQIICRDFKPSNILLTQFSHIVWELSLQKHLQNLVHHLSYLCVKSDVYSFKMVLVELLTECKRQYPLKDALYEAALAFQCLRYSSKHWPSMNEVVETLGRN
ncbi:hypothetical protein NL676_020390 [Syzygium grande]|nr:hypothetical protein NL676_020390 [Syzygium grande]